MLSAWVSRWEISAAHHLAHSEWKRGNDAVSSSKAPLVRNWSTPQDEFWSLHLIVVAIIVIFVLKHALVEGHQVL